MGPNERWTAIAAEVDGKTKKECAARAKERRSSVSAVVAAAGAPTDDPDGEWSSAQQLQLEAALDKYPPSGTMGPNERWTAIAAEVDGKTKKECAARAKERRSSVSAVVADQAEY
jgi:hypothetical protein